MVYSDNGKSFVAAAKWISSSTNSSKLDNEHYCKFHKELNKELRTL